MQAQEAPLKVSMEKMSPMGLSSRTDVTYAPGQKVSSLLNEAWGEHQWRPELLGYGVQKKTDKRYPPTSLRWSSRPWNDPTMQELFGSLSLVEGERYYLVVSELDVTTKHPIDGEYTQYVHDAVYWLSDLYLVDGLLRQLKEHA